MKSSFLSSLAQNNDTGWTIHGRHSNDDDMMSKTVVWYIMAHWVVWNGIEWNGMEWSGYSDHIDIADNVYQPTKFNDKLYLNEVLILFHFKEVLRWQGNGL